MNTENSIQPFSRNPRCWQFNGKPVMLLGGTIEDNVFPITNLAELDIFTCQSDSNQELFDRRAEDGAYLTLQGDQRHAVNFHRSSLKLSTYQIS